MSTKSSVLALLEGNRESSISGEAIAKQLNISRNAVWKAVKNLRKDGYQISAVPNKGYCLSGENDILSAPGMLPFLLDKEQVDRIFVYDELDTTNNRAKNLAISGAEHGTTVIADSQTCGRGRYNRSFYSPAGRGLYMSLVLRPDHMALSVPTLITAFAAVSVCNAIQNVTGKQALIKWVNDIFLERKKICGILTEAVTDFETGNMQWIVIGIGLNFRTRTADFPPELRETAGALYSNGTASVTRNQLAAEIINQITCPNSYTELSLLEQYRKRLMMLNQEVLVVSKKESYTATAIDIDSMGRLVFKTQDGDIQSLSTGEIRIQV